MAVDPYAAFRGLISPSASSAVAAPAVSGRKMYSTSGLPAPKPKDSGGGGIVSDVWSGLGGGLMKLLDWVDTGRATAVSGYKEAADAGLGKFGVLGLGGLLLGEPPKDAKASWNDFTKQIGDNIGFGQVIEEYRPNAPHWAKVAGGFTGDVLLDPLTYLSAGTSTVLKKGAGTAVRTAGEQLADDALRAAVKSGSSKSMTNALITSAKESGFALKEGGGFADDAINRLLVETQKRGAGALTQKALVRAGVTEEMAGKLGLGRLGRSYYGVAIPKSSALVDLVEGAKGGIKASFRVRPATQFLRGKFGEEVVQNLRRIAFDEKAQLSRRAEALVAETAIQQPKRAATAWAKLTQRRVQENWSGVVRDAEGTVDRAATKAAKKAGAQSWHSVDEAVARTATANVEAGISGPLEDAFRKESRQILNDLQAAGVPIGDLGENHVSHFVTDEARVAARKSSEVRKVLDDLGMQSTIEQSRTLVAGTPFLGSPLVTGSIDEINGRMLAVHGVKLFEDNIQVIMPKYLRSAENAMRRHMTYQSLEKFGLSGPLLERVERQLNPDKSWVGELADLQARRDVLVGEQQVHLVNGATLRRDGLVEARVQYARQATELRSQLKTVEKDLAALERKAAAAEVKVAAVTGKLDAAKASVKHWQQQVKALKGDARIAAVKELKAAEQTVREQVRELRTLKGAVKEVSARNVPVRQVTERLSPLRQQILAKQAEKAALESRVGELKAVLENVSVEQRNTLIATERAADRSLQTAKARAKQLVTDVKAATDEAHLAVNAHQLAQADAADVSQVLNNALTEVKTQIDSLTGLPSIPKNGQVRLRLQNDLRERFNTLLQVINDPNTSDELRAIAGIESAAAHADLQAADLGDHIGLLDDMIKITKGKKEIEKMLRVVSDNSVQVADNLQLPQWLFDATTVQHAVKDISKAGLVFEKYMNLFRAYTTFRPGFHVRNAYTALFNMYLEGGVAAFDGIKKWHQFYRMVEKNPENYMLLAERKFGAETAGRLNDALEVMYGSGAGHVASRTAETSFGKGGFNLLDPNNRMIARSRKIGSAVEDHVRGAHAFAVLERGGSKDLASDIIAKWHFNYSDLGSWDKAAKNIVPFWTFFSRNLALQAQTYVRNIPRYNRAMTNFKRNMESDSTDPTVLPQYFQRSGAVRISGGNQPKYWFPDLPMTMFANQVDQFTSLSRMPELLSSTSPLLKAPLEAWAGKSLYTGIPTGDKYVPAPLGLAQLLQATGIELPDGVTVNTPNGVAMKASWAQAFNSLFPGFGQIERTVPTSEGGSIGWQGFITGMTGLGTRNLDAKAIAGENIRRKEEARLKAKYAKSLASFGK